MKENLKNKKVVYTIIGIVSVLLVMIAVTYAYWLVTKTQTGENQITAGCLDITISGEKNDIELTNQFPMSDEDGMKLVPYEFTVTNNCNTSVDYQVALEAIGDSSNALSGTSLKVALNDSAKLYSAYPSVETTIEGAYESRVIEYSRLSASGNDGSSATYSLRIWIDEDAPIIEMNKTFTSKINVTIGQGIESPYEEETLAYSILANYGGEGTISEIDPTWIEGTYGSETYQSMNKSTSYYWGTEMNFNETNGKYKLGGTVVQATTAECRNGQKSDGTPITCSYTLRNSNNAEYGATTGYKVTALTSSSKSDTSSTLYITVQKTGTASNPFNNVTTANDAGVYKTQDDLGDSYYFRGNVSNNYVQFGSYAANTTVNRTTFTEETPIYWRIIRINGDGTIRLAYDGTTKTANGTTHTSIIGKSAYNSDYDNAKYVGYTYDTSETDTTQVNSTIKGVVDTWYDTYLENNYGTYIADSIFCNDRSISRIDTSGHTYYEAYDRIYTYRAPSLKCTNKADRYTMDDTTNGNGLLSNPVGLITADEELFAGVSSSYYLYNGSYYWTLTSSFWGNDAYGARVWRAYKGAGFDSVSNEYGVRPVINLKADVKFTGDGTIDNPYKIVTEQ